MTILDKAADATTSIVVTCITATGGAVVWLVRRILTNQAQIELLSKEIDHRDTLRQMDRADITEVKESVKRIEGWIVDSRKS